MKSKGIYANIFELNLAIIFISTSGVLGRYIDLPVPMIIFPRAFIAGIFLFLYCKIKGVKFKIETKDRLSVLVGGFLLGAHWITYFYALKLSNVAVGMLSLYTFPVITTILEPIILKSKFLFIHFVLGVMVLFGVYLLTQNISFESEYFKGICLGVFSAFCFSVRNIMLKAKVNNYNQSVLMFSQLAVISVFTFPMLIFFDDSNLIEYLPTTLLLALLTTAIGHTLFVYSLRNFSTASASLISSLQPIYGIVLAVFFLREYPSLMTALGGVVIISTVVIESLRIKMTSQKEL